MHVHVHWPNQWNGIERDELNPPAWRLMTIPSEVTREEEKNPTVAPLH